MAKLPTDTSVAALSAALAADQPVKDEFADAFANFTADTVKAEDKPGAAPAVAQDKPAEGEAGEEPKTEIEGAPEPAVNADGTPLTAEQLAAKAEADAAAATEAARVAEEAAKATKGGADDTLTRLADMLSERQKPQTQQQPTQPAQQEPLYSAAEVTTIQEFYKEWPEVAPAVEILLKGAAKSTANYIFGEVAKVIGPKMALLDQLADGFQYNEIKQANPDYDDKLHADVTAWIEKQPSYLKSAYSNVMQKGTVTEFNDLVGRYRQETGTTAPKSGEGIAPQPQAGGKAPQAPVTTLSPAAKKAAAALAPVVSKRTGSVQVDPTTYEDAFEQFAKAANG